MRRIALGLAWASALTAVAGFVQPWADIDLREPSLMKHARQAVGSQELIGGLAKRLGRVTVEVRRGAHTVTGDLPSLRNIPKHVSGIQIPQMANREDAKVAMALVELLMGEQQQIGLKSYAVYLLPGLALLGAALLTWLGRSPQTPVSIAVVSAAVAGVGFWKLLTTNTQALFVAITIGRGLWMSLGAYVGLAAASSLAFVAARRPLR